MPRVPTGPTGTPLTESPLTRTAETAEALDGSAPATEAGGAGRPRAEHESAARRLVGGAALDGGAPQAGAAPPKRGTTVRELSGTIGLRGGWPARPVAVEIAGTRRTDAGVEVRAPLPIHPSVPTAKNEIMVATYNVENLFDPADDPAKDDKEFTPTGQQAWTEEKLDRKVDNLGRVLRSTNGGEGPDIVALVEVENRAAVEKLRDRGLEGMGYQSVVHIEGEDNRGIDNAILSKYPLVGEPKLHQVHDPNDPLWGNKKTRGILEATFDVGGGEKLTVFVNHWPSKRGGAESDPLRVDAGRKLRGLVEERLQEDPRREIVLLGDFNANPGEAPLGPNGLAASGDQRKVLAKQDGAILFDTTSEKHETTGSDGVVSAPNGAPVPEMGTHYYHPGKSWSTFDHVIVSPTLLDNQGLAWVPGSTQVVREPFMVTGAGAPKRFYQPWVDPKTHELDRTGYSDHLPVVARLRRVGAD